MRISTDGKVDQSLVDKVEPIVLHIDKTWTKWLRDKYSREYHPPKVVLFEGSINTECGLGIMNFGPFYCSNDKTVYLDIRWFSILSGDFGAEIGDFTLAYILAHEIGHAGQDRLGIFHRALGPGGEDSVRVRSELQCDYFAGLWAREANDDPDYNWSMTDQDLDVAISAAHAVGDDNMQSRKGVIDKSRWGHGSSKQRSAWFTYGYESNIFDDKILFRVVDLDTPPAV